MTKTIRIACKGAAAVDIKDLKELQGDLKDLSVTEFNKLQNEIINTGFAFPINVWKDPEGALWIVGGHQRKRVLEKMRQDGFDIPPVPVAFIEAKDVKEAKRRVMQDVGQYGKVNSDGLYKFILGAEISLDDLANSFRVPDLDMDEFNEEFRADGDSPAEEGVDAEIEFSKEIDEKHDYLVFVFETKEAFKAACEKYGVTQVAYNCSATLHDGFEAKGLGRILDGGKLA